MLPTKRISLGLLMMLASSASAVAMSAMQDFPLDYAQMLFVGALFFTYMTFRDKNFEAAMMFPILSALFWLVLAMASQSIFYVGFGSTSVITYTNTTSNATLMLLFGGIGVLMLIWGFYRQFQFSKKILKDAEEGRQLEV